MHLEQGIVSPEIQVVARRIGWAAMTRAADAHNPASAEGHLAVTQTAAPDWFGTCCRLRLCAYRRRGNRDGTLERPISCLSRRQDRSLVSRLSMPNPGQSQTQILRLTANSLCGIVQGDWHISPAKAWAAGQDQVCLKGEADLVQVWCRTPSFQNARWIFPRLPGRRGAERWNSQTWLSRLLGTGKEVGVPNAAGGWSGRKEAESPSPALGSHTT
jgi:hypothetical protein